MDAALAYRTHNAFGLAGLAAFPRHGPRNVRLAVDVVDTGLAEDARTLILVFPLAIEGLIFVPDEQFPSSIVMGRRSHRVFRHELPDLGPSFRDAVAQARRQIVTA